MVKKVISWNIQVDFLFQYSIAKLHLILLMTLASGVVIVGNNSWTRDPDVVRSKPDTALINFHDYLLLEKSKNRWKDFGNGPVHIFLKKVVLWHVMFFQKTTIPGLFCAFSSYPHDINWEKRRWCAWDSNPGWQDGKRR